MGTFSTWHLLILLAVVVILFGGGGKLSRIMGDFGKGISAFKSGIKDVEADRGGESAYKPASPDAAIVDAGLHQQESIRR